MTASNDPTTTATTAEADAGKRRRRRAGRGLGPFSGAQLTVVIVAVAAMFAIPTAALAASGAFTSSTAAPAVSANNTSKNGGAVAIYGKQLAVGKNIRFGVRGAANGKGGVGVEGAGSKYGVFSNGPFAVTGDATINGNLQISAGKSFACGGCVGTNALSSAAKKNPHLASGQSQSGVFNVADSYPTTAPAFLEASFAFNRPVTGALTYQVIPVGAPKTAQCAGVGTAAKGFVCIYDTVDQDVATPSAFPINGTGGGAQWTEQGGGFAIARGSYTVTAP